MLLKCPGKIFILGEYACLTGSPALLHTLEPLYELNLEKSEKHFTNIERSSPVYKYIQDREEIFRNYSLTFQSKNQLQIGTGSSSAEFLLVSMAYSLILEKKFSKKEVLERYKSCFVDGEIIPSGVDLLAQYTGGSVVVQGYETQELEPINKNILFYLFYTGKKIKTYEHLREISKKGFPNSYSTLLSRLRGITEEGIRAWTQSDWLNLGVCMNFFQERINEFDFTNNEYKELVKNIQNFEGVIGAKGSGAQGGDCILILVDPEKRLGFEKNIEKLCVNDAKLILPLWTSQKAVIIE